MPSLPYRECAGCTACSQLCHVNAIKMVTDLEGFLRPEIDSKKCINCGMCERVCPLKQDHMSMNDLKQRVYAGKIKESVAHKKSQSGGVFFALASEILNQNGIVYGAAQNHNFETHHIRVSTKNELSRLQGVKYVQSILGDAFTYVAEDLTNGNKVLFSGTPCQVAGLKSYLSSKRIAQENLIAVDLVCYGVPSPGVFSKWIAVLERTYHSRINEMCYRRTDSMWGHGGERYVFRNGKILEGAFYTKLYFNALIIRSSCENCEFCSASRVGDITLGDFWGINKVMPDFFDDRGVSLVICNTEKGTQYLDSVKAQLYLRESSIGAASEEQPRLRGIPVKSNLYQREEFWRKYHHRGMRYIAMEEGYIPQSFLFRIEKKVRVIKRRLGL